MALAALLCLMHGGVGEEQEGSAGRWAVVHRSRETPKMPSFGNELSGPAIVIGWWMVLQDVLDQRSDKRFLTFDVLEEDGEFVPTESSDCVTAADRTMQALTDNHPENLVPSLFGPSVSFTTAKPCPD